MREGLGYETEVIAGIEAEKIKEVSEYSLFRQNWLLAQLYFYQDNIEKAAHFLDQAKKTNFSHPALDSFQGELRMEN